MPIDEETKKKLLYGGGAVASIIALVIYMKNRNAGAQSVSVPTGSGTAAGGTSASDAAAINAATQLAIAQGNQDIQKLQISSQAGISQAQISAAQNIAGIQSSTAKTTAVIGALGGAGGTAAIKGLTTVLSDAVKGIFGGGGVSGKVTVGGGSNPMSVIGPSDYEGKPTGTTIYDVLGNIIDDSSRPGYYVELPKSDSFKGSIGFGSNDWHGSSPTDFSAGTSSAGQDPSYQQQNPQGDSAPGTEF